ncbi:MAG: hypothetical protein KDA84_06960, partial [Planctomycetaceae bacterium]|nr:hypothetical protein [Planctomycetaceae bacterium]
MDEIFGPGENATLHIAQPDQDALGLSGRVRRLAPINFDDTNAVVETEARRRRYTSTSWDFKTYARSVYQAAGTTLPAALRNWEVSNNFPPTFSGTDPFRNELRDLLRMNNGSAQLASASLQRKLSVNHVLDRTPNADGSYNPNGRLRFRPLTPHPTDDPSDNTDDYLRLDNKSVSGHFASSGGPSPEKKLKNGVYILTDMTSGNTYVDPRAQEWLARRDRQKLCRDLYVMLYTLGGGQDVDYRSTPYTDADSDGINEEPRLMAQFVVNLVDQMDTDDVMTVFEYDQDLTNGWNLDDDPFRNDGLSTNDRQVVYGLEKQALCFSEAQIIMSKRVLDSAMSPTQHEATEFDDKESHDWTYIELENVTPKAVARFGNGNWQLVMEEDTATTPPAINVRKRWMTLLSSSNIAPNSDPRFVFGTAGDDKNHGAKNGAQQPATEPLVP